MGGGGGGDGTCSLVSLKKMALFPCSPKTKSGFSMFPVPQNCLCSPVPLIFRPLFPCSLKKVPLFPKTHGRVSQMGKQTDLILLDFSKQAFDKFYLNYTLEITPLQILNWIKDFLDNRKQAVVLNGINRIHHWCLVSPPLK